MKNARDGSIFTVQRLLSARVKRLASTGPAGTTTSSGLSCQLPSDLKEGLLPSVCVFRRRLSVRNLPRPAALAPGVLRPAAFTLARRPQLIPVRALMVHAGPQRRQFLARLRRVDPCPPVRGQCERRMGQQFLPSAAVSPGKASPSPVLGPFDESRTQRVTLDVAHDREQMDVLLDSKGLEATLPDTAARLAAQVVAMRVSGQQPVHPAADVAGDLLCDDEVDVIGHHAGCQERERVSSLRLSDQSKEGVVVARVFEEPRAVIAATDDVIVATGDQGSGGARLLPRLMT